MFKLEDKGNCYPYGIERFIIPSPEPNKVENPDIENLDTRNYSRDLKSVSASNHIIFGENSYLGEIMTYYEDNKRKNVIFLDESHRSKYGLTRFSY